MIFRICQIALILCLRLLLISACVITASETHAAVLFYDNCEDAPNPQHWYILGADPVGQPNSIFAYSTERARAGGGSYKLVLPPIGVDGYDSLDKRTEARLIYVATPNINNFEIGKTYWIGYSVYIPSDFKWPSEATVPTGDWLLIGQHHARYEECDGIPNPTGAMFFRETVPKVGVQLQAIKEQCWPRDDDDGIKDRLVNLPPAGFDLVKGAWNDFVIQFRFDWVADSSPFYKMWCNGVLVVDDIGINTTNDGDCSTCGPYWKIGMYGIQDHWLTIYLDEIRVGDASAVYADVAPSGNTSAPTPLTISTSSLGSWTQGIEASGTLAATGGTSPYVWTQTGAPTGFALTAATGAWAITPTELQSQSGQYDFTITCTDDDGNVANRQFTGTITATSTPTGPSVETFEMPETSSVLTVPVTSFSGSATTAGYIITESSSQPEAGADGWVASAPTSATASRTGEVDFWAYVKDADGVVSVGDVETVVITIEDQAVTGWTITATPDVWQADLTTLTPLSVDFDGTAGTLKPSLYDVSSTGDWYFASDVLYTYSTTDPDSAYTAVTASTDAAPPAVTPAEPVLHTGGDKQIDVGGSKLLEVR